MHICMQNNSKSIFFHKKIISQKHSMASTLAWQQDPSTLISIGVVGGVVIEHDLALGCLLIGSFSKIKKFDFCWKVEKSFLILAKRYYKMLLHLPSSSITFISISSKDSILDGLNRADLPSWKKKWHMINSSKYLP